MTEDNDQPGEFASPPCFSHELRETEDGFLAGDATAAADVARWRKTERERLIAMRLATAVDERGRIADEVAAELDRLVDVRRGLVVSLYWPIRGELNLLPWMRSLNERGVSVALPVVVAKAQPLVFRAWTPDGRMERGVWNIPIPADGEELTPDVVLSPVVGFDPQCYRLGYGGGFYDRTLAAQARKPLVIGVGLPTMQIATIYPQPHDIPMDVIVTGKGRITRPETRG
ncbi:5-formyltetrahydrofolate cyclo-ligase [Aurantimonas marina]|uniref:5-formyltetrahydrofolate cyclo-ligase n=1 Tax=Aurantimonas marina TaxID=2780508 RepID=UPI0019D1B7DE|nr:5-formyltetrahydrofolate cyclo-ligase [Aurantimonas marina]